MPPAGPERRRAGLAPHRIEEGGLAMMMLAEGMQSGWEKEKKTMDEIR
jgi:hypothetical protein